MLVMTQSTRVRGVPWHVASVGGPDYRTRLCVLYRRRAFRRVFRVCNSSKSDRQPQESEFRRAWEQLWAAKRELKQAIDQEDFKLAAKLRDESKALADQLPPVQQYLFAQVEKLRSGNLAERQYAIRALGEAGDSDIIPELVDCLNHPQLGSNAHQAIWAIFLRSRNPLVNELMIEGQRLMNSGNRADYMKALDVFGRMTGMEPTFAEGFNKRATVLYLLKRYEESIADCEKVLELQPFHFAALSGMGLCYMQLSQQDKALDAFERALEIHPGLSSIVQYVEKLKRGLQEQRQQQQEGQGGGQASRGQAGTEEGERAGASRVDDEGVEGTAA